MEAQPGQNRSGKGGLITALLLSLFSAALQLSSLVAPGWLVVKADSVSVNIGLFWYKACSDSVCVTGSGYTGTQSSFLPSALLSYQITTIIGFVFIILTCIVAFVASWKFSQGLHGPNQTGSGVCALISGAFAISASARFGSEVLDAVRLLNAIDPKKADMIKFPYALFLTFIGGILALCVAIIAMIFRCCVRQQAPPASTVNVPMNASRQMHAVAYEEPRQHWNNPAQRGYRPYPGNIHTTATTGLQTKQQYYDNRARY